MIEFAPAPSRAATQWTVDKSSMPNGVSKPSTRSATRSKRWCVAWLCVEELERLLRRLGRQFDFLLGAVLGVGITGNEVTFDGIENVAKVLGIGALESFGITQAQRLTGLLNEICEFVQLKQRDERVHQTR